MKNLARSICGLALLLPFSASAVDFYKCKPRMQNLSDGKTIAVDRYVASVVVSNDIVLYSATPNASFDKCEVTKRNDGQYINEYKKCFFDENMKIMFFVEGMNVFDLHSCKKTH